MRHMERLTASAVLDPRGVTGIIPIRGAGRRAWDFYRKVPELRSGIEWMANAISRADLYVAERTNEGSTRVEDQNITKILDRLIDTGPSQSDMLKRMVFQTEVTGETFLVPYRDRTGSLVWTVANNGEIRSVGDRVELQVDQQTWVEVDGARVIRIWHPDPEFSWIAESPVVAMESVLLQIIATTSRSIAVSESRLAGNGWIGIPDTLNVVQPASEGSPNPTTQSRDFISAFEEAAVAPMTDRGLVSSVVPLLFTGPKDDIGAIVRGTLDSPLDEKTGEQLILWLRRMAMAMGLPPEIILGLGDTNHWTSEDIIREAIDTAVEPRLDTFTSGITESYLRPELATAGYDPERFFVAADINDLVIPPDRSEAAEKARNEGRLTDEAWARYMGFEESDIPTGEQRKQMLIERVLLAEPAHAPWLLPELGIEIPGFTSTAENPLTPPAAAQPPEEQDEPPSDPEQQQQQEALSQEPPAAPEEEPVAASVESVVVDAVETAVISVLQRSNNRLLRSHSRDKRGELRDVPITDLHTHLPVRADQKSHLLKGAYEAWQGSMPNLVPLVDTYVNYLYDNQYQHSRELLTDTLQGMARYWPKDGEPVA